MTALQLSQETTLDHKNEEKISLIKRMYCKNSTNDEFELFLHVCKRTGLDPTMRQIYPVKRWDSSQKKEIMTIQTGIDGYRLIAERTGKYSPGKDTEYGYDENGKLRWAKAFVKKMTPDGTWHEISATAFWDEYVQTTKDGVPTKFWSSKAHIMLGKCAEALALRKTFPAELSGLYTNEEMAAEDKPTLPPVQKATEDEDIEISDLDYELADQIEQLLKNDPDRRQNVLRYIKKKYNVDSFAALEKDDQQWIISTLINTSAKKEGQ